MNTSHRLLSREIYMPDADQERRQRAISYYFRMKGATSNTLLCSAFLVSPTMKKTMRNKVTRAENEIRLLGLQGLLKPYVNPRMAASIVRNRFTALARAKSLADKGSRLLSINPQSRHESYAETYLETLPRQLGRTLLMIRTDCCFGKTVFTEHQCRFCASPIENSSWWLLCHLTDSCKKIPAQLKLTPCFLDRLLFCGAHKSDGTSTLTKIHEIITSYLLQT